MTLSKQLLTTLCAAASVATLSACGSSSKTTGSGGGHPGAAQVQLGGSASSSGPVRIQAGGSLLINGHGPVDTIIAVDRTTLLHADPPLANAYKSTGLQAAAPTVQRGGLLSIVVFGRIASKALNIYTIPIPTLSQEGPAVRDDTAQTAAVAAALDVATGLKDPSTPTAAEALSQITHPEGSDIGAMIGDAIKQMSQSDSSIRNVVVLTDGYALRDAQPPLWTVLAHHGAQAGGAQIVQNAAVPAGTRAITLLWVAGLGTTSGKVDPGPMRIGELQTAYSLACRHLPVRECSASPEIYA